MTVYYNSINAIAMNKPLIKKILPHLVAIVLYIIISLAYFSPQINGKKLSQHDINMWRGSAQELIDYEAQTGEQSLWCGSMFSGMPAYLIGINYPGAILTYVDRAIQFIGRPACLIFVTMLGFYFLLLVLGVNPWLSIVGGIAYGFSTYFFIVIGAGHNAKIHAISYVAPMIAGMILSLRGKFFSGFAVFSMFFALNILTGHPQITYYAAFVMAAIAIAELCSAYKSKMLPTFTKGALVLLVAGTLAVGANFSRLWFTYDYGKDSIRGKTELTTEGNIRTSGLDKDYATQWSYGKMETFNLLIPNLMGGSSSMNLGTDCETYKFLRSRGVPNNQCFSFTGNMPTYWGAQPMTSGPVYIGAIVIFLFVLGLILVKGPYKWALAVVSLLGIMLAWGHNFMFLSDFFLDYFPGYNKFRTVSMILYIVEVTMPLLGFLALKEVFDVNAPKQKIVSALKWAAGVTAGICLFFALFGGAMFNFEASYDGSMGLPAEIIDTLHADRAAMLRADSFRSMVFILLAATLLFLFIGKKLNRKYIIPLLGLLVITDMWVVNKRFMDNSNFVNPTKIAKPFTPTNADKQIMADKSYFRVFNLTVSPFNDASTSYYHKSIGGYHGAKMRRYQELIDQHLAQGSMGVINMLNTKYIIQNGNNGPVAQLNAAANGPAWFADSLIVVANADEEIAKLGEIDTKTTALVDTRFAGDLAGFKPAAGAPDDIITIQKYAPNRISYTYSAQTDKLAVFSEIYYAKGWNATIDGKPANHFRANYVLRAMVVPAGKHTVEFEFAPKMWTVGKTVDYASSILILLTFAGYIFVCVKKEFASK